MSRQPSQPLKMTMDIDVEWLTRLIHAHVHREPISLHYQPGEGDITYYITSLVVLHNTQHSGGRQDRMVELSVVPNDSVFFGSRQDVSSLWKDPRA